MAKRFSIENQRKALDEEWKLACACERYGEFMLKVLREQAQLDEIKTGAKYKDWIAKIKKLRVLWDGDNFAVYREEDTPLMRAGVSAKILALNDAVGVVKYGVDYKHFIRWYESEEAEDIMMYLHDNEWL